MTKLSTKTALSRRLKNEQVNAKRQLESELFNLEQNIKRAREAIKAGEGLDAHMITNAGYLTAEIMRWNLMIDLIPYTDLMAEDEA